MYEYEFCSLVLVPGDPLRTNRGHLNYLCPLYTICASMRLNYLQCSILPSGDIPRNSSVQPSEVRCHLLVAHKLQHGSVTGVILLTL